MIEDLKEKIVHMKQTYSHAFTTPQKYTTSFFLDLESIGSSAANIADENIMQNNIILLKWL